MSAQKNTSANWKIYALVSLIGLVGITIAAVVTRLWVLTAIPVGFLFGMFLQKGDLCGASACSEVLLMADRRKLFGLWVVIAVAMLGFAGLDLAGLVKMNPKAFLYLNAIIGGFVFGVGTVLAGGCVSGNLFKAGAGNLNSIAALPAIPVGVMIVEFGPLHPFHVALKAHVLNASDGGPLTLPSVLGIPYWILALAFALATVLMAWSLGHRKSRTGLQPTASGTLAQRVFTRSWKPWVAGVAIGLLMVPAYLSSAASGRNYPLGVTHGVMQAELLLIEHDFRHVYQKKTSPQPKVGAGVTPEKTRAITPVLSPPTQKKIVWWLVALVASMVVGSWVSARMSGQAKLLPKPPEQIVVAVFGGLLVGIGAAIGGGCVVGNVMSGWAMMSLGTVLFGVVFLLSNWLATYFYLMGGQRAK